MAIAQEMERRRAELEQGLGPVLVSSRIPARQDARAVTASLREAPDQALVVEMRLDDGQVGYFRGTSPLATTVSDAQHWALAGRRKEKQEVELTAAGQAIEVLNGNGVWLAIVEPFDTELPIEVRFAEDGGPVELRTITLPRFESTLDEERRGWLRRRRTSTSVSGWAWFDPVD